MGKKINSFASYDEHSDSLYIAAEYGNEEEVIELVPGVNLELNESGKVIGIEILKASRFFQTLLNPKKSPRKLILQAKEPVVPYKTRKTTKKNS